MGDRTGTRRPFEEVTGIAEQRRTEEARREAQAAENEVAILLHELNTEQEKLNQARENLENKRRHFQRFRSNMDQKMLPLQAKILSLRQQLEAIDNMNSQLSTESSNLYQQLEIFQEAFLSFQQSTDDFTDSNILTSKDQVALQFLLTAFDASDSTLALSSEDLQIYDLAQNLINGQVSQHLDLLKETLELSQDAYMTYIDSQLSPHMQSIHEQFNVIHHHIASNYQYLDRMTEKSQEIRNFINK